MNWAEAMKVLDFALSRTLPAEVKAIDEERTMWMVVVGSPKGTRYVKGPGGGWRPVD